MSPSSLPRKSSASSTLSRTSSSSSSASSSSKRDLLDSPASARRRTRKRISPLQLKMLESLFQRDTHPSREDRDALANTIGMEPRSVTIWFQNKRQTARKIALHNATNMHNVALQLSDGGDSSDTSTPNEDRRLRTMVSSLYELPEETSSSSAGSSPGPSPPRHYVEYSTRRSLAWSCARERGGVTANGTAMQVGWTPVIKPEELPLDLGGRKTVEDDIMKAALALCGLRG